MEVTTLAINRAEVEILNEDAEFSKHRLMCMSEDPSRIRETFEDAEIFTSIESLMAMKDRAREDHPDAVIFFVDEISESFLKQLRYTSGLLHEFSIPVIVIADRIDLDEKKVLLKNGADDCFTRPIHPEGFGFWIDFLKRFKKFSKENTLPPVEHVNFQISFSKRMFDIIMASVALVLASPIMIIIAIAIWFDSRGPVFYISKRAGSGYKIFNFLKFRTMNNNADSELSKLKHLNQYGETNNESVFFKLENDPRVTRLGNFLRNTSLDELPQLINVLKGDMSIVGNRPLPLYEAQQLTREECAMRFMTAAGITGLWQVTKRGKKNLSEEERIALDVQYARNNSFQQDLMLIFKTLPALKQEAAV